MVTKAYAAQVITSKYRTEYGESFRVGRRTEAHIDYTIAKLKAAHPKARLVIIQGCYHKGVDASAHTHDFDGCLDLKIIGLGWWDAQKFLRQCGWACWYRHTGTWAAKGAWHIHAISLGCPGPMGDYVDGGLSQFGRITATSQIDDYHRHALGLKGEHNSGEDHSWFPPNIDATIFDFAAWLEDDMTPQELSDAIVKALQSNDGQAALRKAVAHYVGDVVPDPTPAAPKNTVWVSTALARLLKKTGA